MTKHRFPRQPHQRFPPFDIIVYRYCRLSMPNFLSSEHFCDVVVPLSIFFFFCFYQLGLCSVTYTASEYSIYHFCVMIKDFSISFSRVIIVQDFETVILCIICIQTDLCYFLLNKKSARFKSVQ